MPIRPVCHLTEQHKIVSGVAALDVAIMGFLTGHHGIAGAALASAAGFLFKPTKSIAKKLTDRPMGRLASAVGLYVAGWGAQVAGVTGCEPLHIKPGHLVTGTAINIATTIYLMHFMPGKEEREAVLSEPKVRAALQTLPGFLKRAAPSDRSNNLAVD